MALIFYMNAHFYGINRIAQLPANDSQEADYFLGDVLGSVRQMADESGAVVHAASYDPYGEVLSTNGVAQTSNGYAGEEMDSYLLALLRIAHNFHVLRLFQKRSNPSTRHVLIVCEQDSYFL